MVPMQCDERQKLQMAAHPETQVKGKKIIILHLY